jgi:indoleamine 2,3-dioxygenase
MAGPPQKLDLERFEISETRGFLPADDPIRELPPACADWQSLAAELPKRLLTGSVRRAVRSLAPFDPGAVPDGPPLRAAMRALSFLAHAYVWEGPGPADRLPAALAVPWCGLAERLGRPPVLSYASYALDNWRRLEPAGPLALDNLCLLQNFLGGLDEDWFVTVHVAIEAAAAPILRSVGPALAAAAACDGAALEAQLEPIAGALEEVVRLLGRMPERCDPVVYYRRVRPFIHGWKNHPDLPDGLVYEGVARFGGEPQRLRGETGAQSAIVPVLDALLGVPHADDPLRAYLDEMRGYMPPAHRAFLAAVEGAGPLRPAVQALRGDRPLLGELHDACLQWLEAFRSLHLEYAARYIHRQAESGAGNPTAVGTGGTPFMPYLRKHRDETARARLGEPASG